MQASPGAPQTTRWPIAESLLVRALLIFVPVSLMRFTLWAFNTPSGIIEAAHWPWWRVSVWIGKHVFAWSPEILGSDVLDGESHIAYLMTAVLALFALVVSAVWTWRWPSPAFTRHASAWMRTLTRYSVAAILLRYGLGKVWKSQFPFPRWDLLFTNFAQQAPIKLLWNVTGISTPYTVFGGLGEVLGAVLLLFRRTTRVGALILIAVMTNVVMLNFSYNITVKLYSSLLLFAAVVLVAPDAWRLGRAMLTDGSIAAQSAESRLWNPRVRWLRPCVKTALVIAGLTTIGIIKWHHYVSCCGNGERADGEGAPKPARFGAYDVESFSVNGVERPPLLTDTQRWRRFAVLWSGVDAVETMDEHWQRYDLKEDVVSHRWTLTPRFEEGPHQSLQVTDVSPTVFELDGNWAGSAIHVRLKRIPEATLALFNHPFRFTVDD